eukprot:CAMPEP_0175164568 /NCGR_PEP_ID=MMETSP0087-20121206/26496_1 /TAXON_ID=136419 /ORGANISM="Unknown Unknown, Strain D1" /LENGTH=440 /DNA_ID=CAMNT_0016453635 /DNA_START=44 /DNA_END=1367 /DNA_ORIENTATION=+
MADGVSFITLGDWGGTALQEGSYSSNAKAVAKQLDSTYNSLKPSFLLNTGDNFYWCGIQNTSDFQIKTDFLDLYGIGNSGFGSLTWYGALGNHEYGYNVTAQLELTNIIQQWSIPDRYYTQRIHLEGDHWMTVVVLDTSPCISEYRSSQKSGWDPCGEQYPTCSLSGGKDNFEGPCEFHQNILTQDCSAQAAWLKGALAKVPSGDWLVVNGHHPADEIDVEDLTSVLQQHGFDLYVNGHAHTLSHYSIDGAGIYVTSGAGSCVNVEAEDTVPPMMRTAGKNRTYNKVHGIPLKPYAGHAYKRIFNQKVAGFTTHTFSADYSTLTTNFVTSSGATIHSFTVAKGGKPTPSPAPAPPSPSPPPAPSPSPSAAATTWTTAAALASCAARADATTLTAALTPNRVVPASMARSTGASGMAANALFRDLLLAVVGTSASLRRVVL